MKITIYLPWAYPLFNLETNQPYGGSEVRLVQLGKALSRMKGLEVTFVCYANSETEWEIRDGVKIYRVNLDEKWGGKSFFKRDNKFIRFIKKRSHFYSLLEKADGDVLFQVCASEETGWIARYCKRHGKKFVYFTAHDMDVTGEFARKNKIAGRLYLYGLKNASLIIVQNEQHRRILLEKYGLDSKVLRNPIEIPDEKPAVELKKDILWVGRGDAWKRPEIFVSLAEALPQYRFMMIMPRSRNHPRFFEEIKDIAKGLNNLNFIDYVPHDEISAYYERAKVFVSTSDYEGFPNTFLEAGRVGTPIVSLNVDPDGFLKKHGCGLNCDGNVNDLVHHVRELMIDAKKWKELSSNVRSYLAKYHDISVISEQLIGYLYHLTQ